MERTAHSLKGALRNIGGTQAALLSDELEKMGKQSRLEGAQVILQNLEKELVRISLFFDPSAETLLRFEDGKQFAGVPCQR